MDTTEVDEIASLKRRIAELEREVAEARRTNISSPATQCPNTKDTTPSCTESASSEKISPKGFGIRILDLSRVLAGPFCTMLLADLGADVIKLEKQDGGDDSRQFPPFVNGTSLYYVNLNRGKRSITLDLKDADGRAVFMDLVRNSDVVVENFSPGTMDRLGLGYEDLNKVNPRIIFASISGFGQTGPLSQRPGYDIIAQAMSGLMSITGWPETPPTRAGTAVGDIMAALFTSVGIFAALFDREHTGVGQHLDVSLLDSLFSCMGQHLQKIFAEGQSPGRIGNRYEFIYPYDSFHASDGWVIIAIANDDLWARFVKATRGLPDVSEEFQSELFRSNPKRLEHHAVLKTLMEQWTTKNTVASILELLLAHRIPACPILSLAEAAVDPHLAGSRRMVVEVDQPGLGPVRLLGNALKMSMTHPAPRGPAPTLGQHTDIVLKELLSYTDEKIASLRKREVI